MDKYHTTHPAPGAQTLSTTGLTQGLVVRALCCQVGTANSLCLRRTWELDFPLIGLVSQPVCYWARRSSSEQSLVFVGYVTKYCVFEWDWDSSQGRLESSQKVSKDRNLGGVFLCWNAVANAAWASKWLASCFAKWIRTVFSNVGVYTLCKYLW